MGLVREVEACVLCAQRFEATATAHRPRPVVWFDPKCPPDILIAGQAPGARVHESGRPFTDASGDRLRAWLGLEQAAFYDRERIAIVPMAFCFPGYSAAGSDLPPPPICARTWRDRVMEGIGRPKLTVLVGSYAIKWHLDARISVQGAVEAWRDFAPSVFPLPHPSWRNTAWLKRNAWFEEETVPALREAVKDALS